MNKLLNVIAVLAGVLVSQSAHADYFKWLQEPMADLQARADIILEAQKGDTLDVEYFDIGHDQVSLTAMELLRDAARRGVKVRVIVDDMAESMGRPMLFALAETSPENFEIRFFNSPKISEPTEISNRDHSKMLNRNGDIMFVGGRNIKCGYFWSTKKKICKDEGKKPEVEFRDLDAVVTGQAAQTAKKMNFDVLWNNKEHVRTLSQLQQLVDDRDPSKVDQVNREMARFLQAFKAGKMSIKPATQDYSKKGATDRDFLKAGFTEFNPENSIFFYDDPTKGVNKQAHQISEQLVDYILANTKEDLTILNPYLFPSAAAMDVLDTLLARGVHVKIITNSLKSTDNLFVQAGYRSIRLELIKKGVELYEYQGPETEHAKAAVIDHKFALVGSFNMDPRSSQINREIGIGINDPSKSIIGTELSRIIEGEDPSKYILNDECKLNANKDDNGFQCHSLLIGKDGHTVNDEMDKGGRTVKDQSKWDTGVSKTKIDTVNALQKALPVLPHVKKGI